MIIQRTTVNSNSIGFVGLLTIVLIVLKLTGLAPMSWLWALCPLWIVPSLVLVIGGIVFLAVLLFSSYKEMRAKQRRNKRQQG